MAKKNFFYQTAKITFPPFSLQTFIEIETK